MRSFCSASAIDLPNKFYFSNEILSWKIITTEFCLHHKVHRSDRQIVTGWLFSISVIITK